MDAMLRKAVDERRVEGVRSRLADIEVGALGGRDEEGRTVLHFAAEGREFESGDIVELLVGAMTEEQVSLRTFNGETVLHHLLSRLYTAQCRLERGMQQLQKEWVSMRRKGSLAIVAKLSEEALFEPWGNSVEPPILLLFSRLCLLALQEVIDRFPGRIERDQELRGRLFKTYIGAENCSLDEGEEAILLQLVEMASASSLQDCLLPYGLALRGFPASAILRMLRIQHGTEATAAYLRKRGRNVLHGIADAGREELLDLVMPFVSPAYMQQRTVIRSQTPRDRAVDLYRKTKEERYMRIAARLQTFVKSAAD
mmetsp:Transcript_8468/g.35369  ORF Transcript_8468/g.35369 Transcript_8468/m.35369 type:complete len:312 (+) Transcript_8468:46-981(+)